MPCPSSPSRHPSANPSALNSSRWSSLRFGGHPGVVRPSQAHRPTDLTIQPSLLVTKLRQPPLDRLPHRAWLLAHRLVAPRVNGCLRYCRVTQLEQLVHDERSDAMNADVYLVVVVTNAAASALTVEAVRMRILTKYREAMSACRGSPIASAR
jgi:hypothetical protein